MIQAYLTTTPVKISRVLEVGTIIFLTVLTYSSLYFCKGDTCAAFFWSFSLVWLPVILGYIVSFLFSKKGKNIGTTTRLFSHVIASFIFLFLINFIYLEDSGYIFLFILFVFLPAQFLLVLLIEFILKMTRNQGSLSLTDRRTVFLTLFITILSTLIAYATFFENKNFKTDLVAWSGLFVWGPLVLSYVFPKGTFVNSGTRILSFLFSDFICILVYSYYQIDSRSSLNILYFCLSFIAQAILIPIIDTIRKNAFRPHDQTISFKIP